MARPLSFALGEQTVAFGIGSKVSKQSLYGRAQRIAEKDGKTLARGALLGNGTLLPSGALSLVRADPDGTPIEDVQILADGVEAAVVPSSFDQTTPLQSVPISALLRFQSRDVYPLTVESGSLDDGLYETQFNYRKSATPHPALVLKQAAQSWLLVGVPRAATFLGMAVSYAFFDDEADFDDSDDLDFQMV